ncbi:complex I 24 kDa subunit family protein [Archangium primigenium]|uniref:NADH-quinone oxidoreductase subunit NuoE family protein n=1 Tax=[Archangium] primigenium TaxID=2792470 RepID=UPI00195A9052|nr:NAD(P)H-dependent oxidoreductase subunit E [Archangium primigenium]MBM7118988.1 NAD(P)H-dependent oxidoreductase subunit E [Archangium primigenium]
MAELLFTPEEQKKFDAQISEILSHYPPDRKSAGMLPALRVLQDIKGWLPPEGIKLVASALEVRPERAYEVASFYVMYHLKKPGKYVIDVCTNLPCALRGAEQMLAYLERKLGLKAGEANALFTLRETECLASCGTAPCLQVNEDHHDNLDRAKLDALFSKLS